MEQVKVVPLLGHGEENAMSTAQLVKRLGLRDSRKLRALVEAERAEGALILSTVRGGGGYFLPSSDPSQARGEIAGFVRTVKARALNSLKALRAARRALRECSGQLEIRCQEGRNDVQEESS